jgi:hypothetical protein
MGPFVVDAPPVKLSLVSRDPGEFQSLRPYSADPTAEGGAPRERAGTRLEADAQDLRPRRVGELLDLAFEVLRSRFGTYVGVGAAVWFPMRATQPFLGMHQWMGPGAGDLSPGLIFGFLFNTGGAIVLTFFEVSVFAVLVASHLQGRDVPIRTALRRAGGRLFPVCVIALLAGILTTIGSCACILPGILLTWLFYLAPAVCVIENAGVGESLSRSFELAGSRFLPWIPYALAAFFLGLPFASLAGLVDNPEIRAWMIDKLPLSPLAFDWTMVFVSSLFNGVAAAIRGVVVTVWYFDARARRDGADLEARLALAGAATSTGAST